MKARGSVRDIFNSCGSTARWLYKQLGNIETSITDDVRTVCSPEAPVTERIKRGVRLPSKSALGTLTATSATVLDLVSSLAEKGEMPIEQEAQKRTVKSLTF